MNLIFLTPLNQDRETLKTLYEWRAHPIVQKASFSQSKFSFEEFVEKFPSKYHAISELAPLSIIYNQNFAGVVFFEKWFRARECVLSIYLDPKLVNHKIGTKALEKVVSFLKNQNLKKVVAFVKTDNLTAQKAFENAGFQSKGLVDYHRDHQQYPSCKYEYCFISPRKTFIIAEAGSNSCVGNKEVTLQISKTLVEKAYASGADAVKFQLFENQPVYVENAGKANYLDQDINEVFRQNTLPSAIIPQLVSYCDFLGIEWMCSAFSIPDFDLIDPYVQRHKIASYEIKHIQLLKRAAASKKPLILSTGAATLDDIRWARDIYFENGGQHLTLLQCTAQYPALAESLNLLCIPKMREELECPIGLSDHSAHPLYGPIAAVSLGATVIEKHFTLHKSLPGPDNYFSIDCEQLKEMCQAISETEKILGVEKKAIFDQEEELAAFATRGIQAIRDIEIGQDLVEGINIQILRPGAQNLGMHPKHIDEVAGKQAKVGIKKGQGILKEHILW